jgi:AcrR family transcriptional regulator
MDREKKRRYDSPRRRLQAAGTRNDILRAALELFVQRGYAATPMTAIAAEAGVAPKTVYLAFGSKGGLLLALWHLLLRGDEGSAPVGERAWFREVVEETDPAAVLRLNARNSRVVKERAGALLEVLRGAASGDADLAALWSRIEKEFYENQRAVITRLAELGALRADLGADRATDVLWALNHPGVYALFVAGRGWTPEQYEEWLAESSCRQLLAAAP